MCSEHECLDSTAWQDIYHSTVQKTGRQSSQCAVEIGSMVRTSGGRLAMTIGLK